MLDSRITGELLAEARRSGAKLILAGDDRQLASIERGGLFAELRQRHGSAEITEVTRQRVGLAAAGRARPGRGAVRGGGARLRARAGDHLEPAPRTGPRPGWSSAGRRTPRPTRPGRRFVFAYTNKDVDALNAELRQVRRDRGELGGGRRGSRPSTGRRTSRSATGCSSPTRSRRRGIHNGNAGTITAIDARTGVVAGDPGRPGRAGAGGGVVGRGVRRVPARLRRDDLQGPGQDAGPHLPLPLAPLAAGRVYVALTRQRESARGSSPRPRRRGTCASWRGRWAGTRCGRPRWRGPRARSCRPGCGPRPGGPPRAGTRRPGPTGRRRRRPAGPVLTRAGSSRPGSRRRRSILARSPRRWRRTRPRGASGRRWTTTWRARSATRARRGRASRSWSGRTGTPRPRGGSPPTPASSGSCGAGPACSRAAPPARSAPGRGGWPRRSGRRWRASARRRPRPRGPTGTAWRRGARRTRPACRGCPGAPGPPSRPSARRGTRAAGRRRGRRCGRTGASPASWTGSCGPSSAGSGPRACAPSPAGAGSRAPAWVEAERVALAEVGRVVRAVHEARLAASAEAQRLAAAQRARQGARLKP